MAMRKSTKFVVTLALIGSAVAALFISGMMANRPPSPPQASLANGTQDGWVIDRRTGCWIWGLGGLEREVYWTGICGRGPAAGPGALEWRWQAGDSIVVERFTGSLVNGRLDGWGVYDFANGSQYRGQFRAGLQHGFGKMTAPNGSFFEGVWQDGEPRDGRGLDVYELEDRILRYSTTVLNGDSTGVLQSSERRSPE